MTRSAADIISLSTGRESLLIGPPSAFGVQSRELVIRDRLRALAVLELFLTRPHADQLLRPYLRRWGFDPVALQYSDRAGMIEQLTRAVSGGSLALAVVPEVTLAFAAAQDRPVAVRPASLSAPRPHLPDSLQERMVLVLEMVPDHLQGEMLLAFKNAVDGRVELLAIGVVAWVGAHFVPGLNLAILAFDLFCLSGDVIQALETLVTVIRDVRNAGSLEDLKPSARLLAGAIATLIAEGILSRLLKTQTPTRGVGKAGGHPDRKPSPQKTPQRQVEPRRPRDEPVVDLGAYHVDASSKKRTVLQSESDKDAAENFRTFTAHGMSRRQAIAFLKTAEGRVMINDLAEFHQSNYREARARAFEMLASSTSPPKLRRATEPLIKIVPVDSRGVSAGTPYFTTTRELARAQASGMPLHEYFGLPIACESNRYNVYKITPKENANVFVSKVAPTSELDGRVKKRGGAEQWLVTNRNDWSAPERLNDIEGP
ncbi:hypothetical protein [Rhizobium sp. CSW-27]|uniref:hypothetical protein n=1 Tax=Rhizobium sp. CSW-27 TaxID=2839985 RepID=UPI001C038B67|nr:hypothetical protein [Rhizobium sp. CSW-27]MBT9373063.1 hypothetical protein [Rhizobium sp. CSW-27]